MVILFSFGSVINRESDKSWVVYGRLITSSQSVKELAKPMQMVTIYGQTATRNIHQHFSQTAHGRYNLTLSCCQQSFCFLEGLFMSELISALYLVERSKRQPFKASWAALLLQTTGWHTALFWSWKNPREEHLVLRELAEQVWECLATIHSHLWPTRGHTRKNYWRDNFQDC